MVNAAIPVLAVLIAVLFFAGERTLNEGLCAHVLIVGVNPVLSRHSEVAVHAGF